VSFYPHGHKKNCDNVESNKKIIWLQNNILFIIPIIYFVNIYYFLTLLKLNKINGKYCYVKIDWPTQNILFFCHNVNNNNSILFIKQIGRELIPYNMIILI